MRQAQEEDLRSAVPETIEANPSSIEAASLIAERIARLPPGNIPFVGINGAQGSGKSTIAKLVELALARVHGLRAVLLSLDDFYLGRPPRFLLERNIHPLCVTRGVPGTHDVQTLAEVIEALRTAGPDTRTSLPAFDKLSDDRLPREAWPQFAGRPDVILLEGWCVGLLAMDVPEWERPINQLERDEDPNGSWFAWSLATLREDYETIWQELDLLVSIELPDLETVIDSRLRQEQGLPNSEEHRKMDRKAITRFVQHYERYTRALWAAMPERADMLFRRTADFGYSLAKG